MLLGIAYDLLCHVISQGIFRLIVDGDASHRDAPLPWDNPRRQTPGSLCPPDVANQLCHSFSRASRHVRCIITEGMPACHGIFWYNSGIIASGGIHVGHLDAQGEAWEHLEAHPAFHRKCCYHRGLKGEWMA